MTVWARGQNIVAVKPQASGSWGDDKYLLYVDQAVVVTMIISAIGAGVMLQHSRCQQQAGLPHFLMAEASGKQMLQRMSSEDQTGDGLSARTLAIQTSVLGG